MKEIIKKNSSFLSIYFVFAFSVLALILSLGKQEAQLLANSFYSPFFDAFFFYSTQIVEWFSALVIISILLLKGAKWAINGLLVYGLTALFTRILKLYFFDDASRPTFFNNIYRLIPEEFGMVQLSSNSFPSGHTTASFTLFCYLTLISKNKKMGYVYGVIAVLIGYSRVYLSQHFFEDVLAGATIGTFLTFLLYPIFDKINYGNWATKPFIKRK